MGLRPRLCAVQRIGGQGLVRPGKVGRLVHVIPDACDALFEQRPLLLSPPSPDLGIEKVRKPDDAWPDLALIICFSVGLSYKGLSLHSALEDWKVGIVFHRRIRDGHGADALTAELPGHRGQLRESWPHGEHAVGVHVVDVEVEGITRQVPAPELPSHGLDSRLGLVAVAGLVIAQSPLWGQGHGARPLRIALEYRLYGRA